MKNAGRFAGTRLGPVGMALLILCGSAAAYGNVGQGGVGHAGGVHAMGGGRGGHGGGWNGHGGGWGGRGGWGWHGHGGYYGYYGCCGWGIGFYDPLWDPYLWDYYGYGPVNIPYAVAPPLEAPVQGYAPPPAPAYWYYCPDSRTYYPYVRQCASPWQKVPAKPGP
jgi:hypothetical protein